MQAADQKNASVIKMRQNPKDTDGLAPQRSPGPRARGDARATRGRGRRALSPSTIAALPRPRGAAAVLTHPRAARRGPRHLHATDHARHAPTPSE